MKTKGQNVNYNFDTDYIWNRKSYGSRTRHQKNVDVENNNNRLTVIISCEGDIIDNNNDYKKNFESMDIKEEESKNRNKKYFKRTSTSRR